MSSMTGLLLANAEVAQQAGGHHEVSGGPCHRQGVCDGVPVGIGAVDLQ